MFRATVLIYLLFFCFPGYTQVWYQLEKGKDLYINGDYEEAINFLNEGLSEQNSPGEEKAELCYWLAKSYFKKDNSQKLRVISLLNEASEIAPHNPDISYFRARCKVFYAYQSESINQDFRKAVVNISKKNILGERDVLNQLISYYWLGNRELVFGTIKDFKQKSPSGKNRKTHAISNYVLASISAYKNNPEKAKDYLDLALMMDFDDFDLFYLDFLPLLNNPDFDDFIKAKQIPVPELSNTHLAIIKKYVEIHLNEWQKKGRYEKTEDYEKRLRPEVRNKQIEIFKQEAIDSLGFAKLDLSESVSEYDADNESFKISIPGFGPVYMKVPLEEAPIFDRNLYHMEAKKASFFLNSNYRIELADITLLDTGTGKTFNYKRGQALDYSSQQITYQFDEPDFSDMNSIKPSGAEKSVRKNSSDVDLNIPVYGVINPKTYALIIGNEDYTKYQPGLSSESNVDFARNDAGIFAQYAQKTLGVPEENIFLLKDGIGSQMKREIDRLVKLIEYEAGEASVIVFYAGHGFPDENTKESYLMPVDITGAEVNYGIKLNDLFQSLTRYPTKQIVVFLDACFSGGGRNKGLLTARSVRVKPKENQISGNIVVFSSSTDSQLSMANRDEGHGMFTYYLLKSLNESGGDISLGELFTKLERQVKINSIKINNKEQVPTVQYSPQSKDSWQEWRLK